MADYSSDYGAGRASTRWSFAEWRPAVAEEDDGTRPVPGAAAFANRTHYGAANDVPAGSALILVTVNTFFTRHPRKTGTQPEKVRVNSPAVQLQS